MSADKTTAAPMTRRPRYDKVLYPLLVAVLLLVALLGVGTGLQLAPSLGLFYNTGGSRHSEG